MKTTVTEEYEDGKLVRRTTVTDGEPPGYVHVRPSGFVFGSCTCPTVWNSINPPPPCPVHGAMRMLNVTSSTAAVPN